MAIYPIIKGQKFNQTIAIPPRSSLSESSDRPKDLDGGEDNLIDFGDENPAPQQTPPKEQAQPSVQALLDSSHPSTADVQAMLASTGSRKEGPLIDFHQDMKKDLTESDDEFVDAQG
jgi:hypothetical protein